MAQYREPYAHLPADEETPTWASLRMRTRSFYSVVDALLSSRPASVIDDPEVEARWFNDAVAAGIVFA